MGPSFSPQEQGSMGRAWAEARVWELARLPHPGARRPRCCLWEGPAGWRLSGAFRPSLVCPPLHACKAETVHEAGAGLGSS